MLQLVALQPVVTRWESRLNGVLYRAKNQPKVKWIVESVEESGILVTPANVSLQKAGLPTQFLKIKDQCECQVTLIETIESANNVCMYYIYFWPIKRATQKNTSKRQPKIGNSNKWYTLRRTLSIQSKEVVQVIHELDFREDTCSIYRCTFTVAQSQKVMMPESQTIKTYHAVSVNIM